MSTSIQDVARAANVSISTVSRSFTRPELVSKATREKVLRIAEELNFSTSRSAVALKTGRALRVALLVSDHIRLWFSASVIEGLNQVLHEEGYDISIFQISSIEERKEFFEMLPVRRNADAVIVVSFDIDNTEIAQLNSAAVPIVGINSVLPQERGLRRSTSTTCRGLSSRRDTSSRSGTATSPMCAPTATSRCTSACSSDSTRSWSAARIPASHRRSSRRPKGPHASAKSSPSC